MKSYEWWIGRKKRVRKKYTLFLGKYLSPKESKSLHKKLQKAKEMEKKHRRLIAELLRKKNE